mgnify:CR=1 FL=1
MTLLIWSVWYFVTYPNSLQTIIDNWPITLTMVFGSFIAGATSEGGGAIAFPVFTKVLNISPLDAKVFSLAIQSVGMMAATFTIVCMRIAVEWRIVLWASIGGLLGVYLGSVLMAPFLPANLLKMVFTAMIASFALTLILVNWKQRQYNEMLPFIGWREQLILVLAGIFGGIMTGLVGNGIDIICFSVMVLLFQLSEKVSTATSVVLMAFNSVAGFILHLMIIGGFTPVIREYWLAAIPVVVIGAPLGAYFCTRLKNKTIAVILIMLILVEVISSLSLIPITPSIASISSIVFLIFLFIYYQMNKVGGYRSNKITASVKK